MKLSKYVATAVLALAVAAPVSDAYAGRYGGGFRSYRSFSYRSYGGSRSYRSYRPAPSYRSQTNVYHEHNYYGGGGSSPWFWMWMFDHNNQQPSQVVVVPQAQGQAPAPSVPLAQPQPQTYVAEQAPQNDDSGHPFLWFLALLAFGVIAYSIYRNR